MKTHFLTAIFVGFLIAGIGVEADAQRTDRQPQKSRQQPTQRRPPVGRNNTQRDDGLKVGEPAPAFKLKSLDGESETDLATFKNKKPVVLFFGSYT